jgi:2-deoxy-D-gluconate 3-dehydrogenase
MDVRFDDRVAIVTGAGAGLGRQHALLLASRGAKVVVNDPGGSVEGTGGANAVADAVVAEIRKAGGEAVASYASVAEEAAAQSIIDTAVNTWGRLDILVNNAGTSIRKMPQDYSEDEWHHVLDTNLTSAFLCSQAVYPAMVKVGGGNIINIGSMMSLFGAPYATPYAASKGGIVQMTRAMATAWAKDNIQVNAVLPGWIDTDLTRRARQQVEGLHDSVEKRTPHGRWGTPHDMAGIAAFLASSASDFVTGTAIPVDGGFSIGM